MKLKGRGDVEISGRLEPLSSDCPQDLSESRCHFRGCPSGSSSAARDDVDYLFSLSHLSGRILSR